MKGDSIVPQYYSKMKVFLGGNVCLTQGLFDKESRLEWPFEFWDNDDKCRIRQKMEGLNTVVGDVYVLPQMSEVEGAPKRRHLDDGNHVLDPCHQQAAEEGFSWIEKDNEDQFVEPL